SGSDPILDPGTGDLPSDCHLHTHGGHTYVFCTTRLTWDNAKIACAAFGYTLITIDDSTEDTWADTTMDAYVPSRQQSWTGYTDVAVEGVWVWDSGSTSTFTNWNTGQPSNSGGVEHCGSFNAYHPTVAWNDLPCYGTCSYICESP
ncbi:MAG: hypothetical protein JRG91_13605, partial [Deltaproteobacteria bacterium]|nr:hypothetical protein [Deltaproteobacteria bacterium]